MILVIPLQDTQECTSARYFWGAFCLYLTVEMTEIAIRQFPNCYMVCISTFRPADALSNPFKMEYHVIFVLFFIILYYVPTEQFYLKKTNNGLQC